MEELYFSAKFMLRRSSSWKSGRHRENARAFWWAEWPGRYRWWPGGVDRRPWQPGWTLDARKMAEFPATWGTPVDITRTRT